VTELFGETEKDNSQPGAFDQQARAS
jgi:hypothetical protein